MALIKCPECQTEISDKAKKCPQCACPITSDNQQGKVQTIELTGKKYKLHLTLSSALMILTGIIGIVLFIVGYFAAFFFIGLFVLGFIWFLTIKFYVWWDHR